MMIHKLFLDSVSKFTVLWKEKALNWTRETIKIETGKYLNKKIRKQIKKEIRAEFKKGMDEEITKIVRKEMHKILKHILEDTD